MPFISLIGDFILLNVLFVVGYCLYYGGQNCLGGKYILFYTYLNLSWFVLVFSFGANRVSRNTGRKSILFTYIRIIVFFFFFFLMYFQAVPLSYYPRDIIGYLFVSFFSLLIVWKIGLYYAFLLYRKWGFNFRTVVILGYSRRTVELARYFQTNRWHGYRFLGFFDEIKQPGPDFLGGWSDLKEYFRAHHVDEIYVGWNQIPTAAMQVLTELVSAYPVKVRIVPDLGNFSYKTAELVSYGTLPVLKIHRGPLGFWYNRLLKRIFDVALSLLVILTVLSWMVPLLWIVSLFGSREGLFFLQKRTRIDGKVFTCLKFRTMRRSPDADLQQATENDHRVTPLGRFLRKFSLDELPQFFNVLAGDMSVVGPRPHMLRHTEEYRKLVERFMIRHTVKPGITGLAQVNGFRGEIRNQSDIKNRVKFDVNYIENWSFSLDLKIVLITIWLILRGRLWAY
jgi:putative colanic acid biosysnthesis UDP-glucose lipid carrier transferase